MPFRQLPSSDEARLQALQAAFEKVAATPADQLAISLATKTRLETQYPLFRTELEERGTALAGQTMATQAQEAQAWRLRTWTSHFFQVLNMAIERGMVPAAARAFYQLDVSQTALPRLSAEADLILWAGRAVSGEATRVAAGGSPILSPPIAEVSAELAQYQTLRSVQSAKKDAYIGEAADVEALRPTEDDLIRDIWDEVEFHFRHDSPSSLRSKAREYGVYYATRPGEAPDPGPPSASPLGNPPASPPA